MPLNVFVALVFSALAITGYVICRRAHGEKTGLVDDLGADGRRPSQPRREDADRRSV